MHRKRELKLAIKRFADNAIIESEINKELLVPIGDGFIKIAANSVFTFGVSIRGRTGILHRRVLESPRIAIDSLHEGIWIAHHRGKGVTPCLNREMITVKLLDSIIGSLGLYAN